MINHTPGPWEVDAKKVVLGPWRNITTGLGGSERHTICFCDNMRLSHLENEANAYFIVKACNCHDELLAAAEAVLADYADADTDLDIQQRIINWKMVEQRLRAAVKKGQGIE